MFSQSDGFFSGIGGSLSLYLGVAVTMAFEIIELIFDLVTRAIRNNQGTCMCDIVTSMNFSVNLIELKLFLLFASW